MSAGLFAGGQWVDGLAKSLGYESEYHHAVIIDAGSSGSRVLAYKFRVPFTGKSTLAKYRSENVKTFNQNLKISPLKILLIIEKCVFNQKQSFFFQF